MSDSFYELEALCELEPAVKGWLQKKQKESPLDDWRGLVQSAQRLHCLADLEPIGWSLISRFLAHHPDELDHLAKKFGGLALIACQTGLEPLALYAVLAKANGPRKSKEEELKMVDRYLGWTEKEFNALSPKPPIAGHPLSESLAETLSQPEVKALFGPVISETLSGARAVNKTSLSAPFTDYVKQVLQERLKQADLSRPEQIPPSPGSDGSQQKSK